MRPEPRPQLRFDRSWWAVGLAMFALGAGSAVAWWYFATFAGSLPTLPRLLP